MRQVQRTVCAHDCPDQCAILATVEDGRLAAVRGDPCHPFTGGFLCAKVHRYPERVHSPERLLTPLRRDGPKGSGAFRPVSWDEALDEIARRWQAIIDQRGAEAILAYAYSGHMGLVSRNLPRALFHALGTTQVEVGTVCDTTAEAAWQMTYGPVSPLDPESVVHADLVVAWGADVITSNVHWWPFVERALRRGARLVCIAPYRHRTGRRADAFIAIRPGTDGALALGVAHVLFRDGKADTAYLDRDVRGWRAWADSVLPGFPPSRVEALTGVPAGDVERLAAWLADSRAPFLRIGPAIGRSALGGHSVRAVAILPAVLGVWGRPGAGAFLESSYAFPVDYEALRRRALLARPVRSLSQVQLGRALTEWRDPPIEAALIMANNPAVTCPDAGRVRRGLAREDLFVVVHELFMTETAALADLVLPATSSMESEDVYRSYGHLYIQYAPAIMPPLGESRPNAWVIQELARRLGVVDPVFERTVPDHVRALLPPNEPALAERVLAGEPVKVPPTGGPGRWGTSCGHIDFEPPPDFPMEEAASPSTGDDFPLYLVTAPGRFSSHTGFEAVPSLREREGAPRCLLHPDEATRRGLHDGEAVELFNQRGAVGLTLALEGDVPPGIAVVEGVRPSAAYLSGGPINVLTPDDLADMGEGATYQNTRVDVRRLARAAAG